MASTDIPGARSKVTMVAVAALLGATLSLFIACGGGASAPETNEDSVAPVAAEVVNAGEEVSVRELIPILTRYGVGPRQIGIDLTFAPKLFFDVTGLKTPREALDQPTLVFILQENIHEGDLFSDELSSVFLVSNDGERIAPYLSVITADDPHHRVARLLFPMVGDSENLRLIVPFADGTVSVANTFDWKLPLDLGGLAKPDGEG